MFLEATVPTINWQAVLDVIVNWVTTTGVKIILGLIALFIIFKIVNMVCRRIERNLNKKNADKTISKVLVSILRKTIKILVFIVFLGFIGFETASIGAAITSCGVALGLALQGGLSNLAGGIIILLMRPFRIDDYIDAQGVSGTVTDIKLFYTVLTTPDNKVVMVPNGPLANGNIINYSMKDTRRVDLTFGIAYEADFYRAQEIISKVVLGHELVLKDPEPFVRMSEHADSSINIACRAWVNSTDYWTVYFDLMEQVKKEFDANNISIPYPQVDVHITNAN